MSCTALNTAESTGAFSAAIQRLISLPSMALISGRFRPPAAGSEAKLASTGHRAGRSSFAWWVSRVPQSDIVRCRSSPRRGHLHPEPLDLTIPDELVAVGRLGCVYNALGDGSDRHG